MRSRRDFTQSAVIALGLKGLHDLQHMTYVHAFDDGTRIDFGRACSAEFHYRQIRDDLKLKPIEKRLHRNYLCLVLLLSFIYPPGQPGGLSPASQDIN
ncbi:hypothetical protein CUJ89_36470 [Burkholderia pyrrocinia]|uniref:Uncharacterized protein n=1 Tax=Burkholderia pyrrocinia TaxID=60550 RepID=A0A2Z5NCH9_BURPY|nr:hypothetical protein CUJ89_36470 [Burkholderia pyrrocinia]